MTEPKPRPTLSLNRRIAVDDIHSVTIWIRDQRFTLYPW